MEETLYCICWKSLIDAGTGSAATVLTKAEAQKICSDMNSIFEGVAHHWIEPATEEEVSDVEAG